MEDDPSDPDVSILDPHPDDAPGAPASKGQWHDWRAVVQVRWVRIVVTAVVLLGGVGYIVNSVLRKPLLEPQRGQISPRVISKFPADRW